MKESLDAVRNLQTAVLLVSAALLTLALTPNEAVRYQTSLETLRSLPRLPRDEQIVAVRERNHASFRQLLAEVDDVIMRPDVGVTVETPGEGLHGFTAAAILLAAPRSESIADEVEFYSNAARRLVTVPDPDVLRIFLREHLPARRPLRYRVAAPYALYRDRFKVDLAIEADSPYGRPAVVAFEVAAEQPRLGVYRRSMTGRSDEITREFISTILTSSVPESLRRQIRLSKGREVSPAGAIDWLGSLQSELDGAVWEDVNELTRIDAIRRAEERAQRASRSLSLVGLNIDEGVATLGGPLVLAFILGYLLLHLTHIRRLARADASLLYTYPWPPLFPGPAGAMASAMILVVIPGVALARFVARVNDAIAASRGDSRRYVVAASIAFVCVVMGAAAHVVARRLQRERIGEEPLSPTERFVSDYADRWRQAVRSPWVLPAAVGSAREIAYSIFGWLLASASVIFAGVLILTAVQPANARNWFDAVSELGSNAGAFVGLTAVAVVVGTLLLSGVSVLTYRSLGSRALWNRHIAVSFSAITLEPAVIGAIAFLTIVDDVGVTAPDSVVYAMLAVSRIWYLVIAWYGLKSEVTLPARRRAVAFGVYMGAYLLLHAVIAFLVVMFWWLKDGLAFG